jgi:hypothetical protein
VYLILLYNIKKMTMTMTIIKVVMNATDRYTVIII